jgi:hypothetical protein
MLMRGSWVTRSAANADERPGIEADTSITLAPSSSWTVVANRPPLTGRGSPWTLTDARPGETRPLSSSVSSLTTAASLGEVIVRRTAGGSGGGRSSPPQAVRASTASRGREQRRTGSVRGYSAPGDSLK